MTGLRAELGERNVQRERLRRFLAAHLDTIFTQEVLAEACGAHVSSVMTRVGELRRGEGGPAMPLRGHPGIRWTDADGVIHRGMKRWECLSYEPLGRDASVPDPSSWPVAGSPMADAETFELT